MKSTLVNKMKHLADTDDLPHNHPMRTSAEYLDKIVGKGDVRKILGVWARARRIYCDYTGEPLL